MCWHWNQFSSFATERKVIWQMNHTTMNNSIWPTNSQSFSDFEILKFATQCLIFVDTCSYMSPSLRYHVSLFIAIHFEGGNCAGKLMYWKLKMTLYPFQLSYIYQYYWRNTIFSWVSGVSCFILHHAIVALLSKCQPRPWNPCQEDVVIFGRNHICCSLFI